MNMLAKKIWGVVESLIDERFFTDLSSYKNDQDYQKEIKDIEDAISDLAWKIECDMKDSL